MYEPQISFCLLASDRGGGVGNTGRSSYRSHTVVVRVDRRINGYGDTEANFDTETHVFVDTEAHVLVNTEANFDTQADVLVNAQANFDTEAHVLVNTEADVDAQADILADSRDLRRGGFRAPRELEIGSHRKDQ